MKNNAVEYAVPQPGRLTPDQYHALGEIWSFLLHLWYSEPSTPPSSSNHATNSPGKARSLTLNRRKSSFGPLSLLIKNDSETTANHQSTHPPHQASGPRLTKSHSISHAHGASASEGSGGYYGGNTHASESEFSPTSPQPNSYYYQHHHQRSSSASSASQAPASPTRLSQSFRQPSLASSPRGNNSLYTGLGIGGGPNHPENMQSLASVAQSNGLSFAGTPLPASLSTAASNHPISNNSKQHHNHQHHQHGPSSNHLNHQFNDKTAAAVATLRRSAARLKGWVPSKKFTFKYSPAAYHDAFWNFVQNEHPDSVVIRFLKARKWNVERAMETLVLTLEWRISNKLDELAIEDEETLNCKYPGFLYLLKRGKMAFLGSDLEGRPLVYLNPSQDDQNLHLASRRLFLYTIEHARMLLKPPSDRLSVIVDLTTLSMSDVDLNSSKFMIHAVENCYTELLGTGVLYKAPWVFGRIWKAISPLLDPSNRNRLKFASSRKELVEVIGSDCLAYMQPGKGPSPHEAAAALNAELSFVHSKDQQRKSPKEKDGKEPKDKETNGGHSGGGFHFGKDKDEDHGNSHHEPPTHFEFPYIPPVLGENDLFYQDSEVKHRAITRRKELELTFERLTEVWQGQRELSSASMVLQERDAVGYKLVDAFWQAEPYTRVRSVFHRAGVIQAPEPFFSAPTTLVSTAPTTGASIASPAMISPPATTMLAGAQTSTTTPFASSEPPSFGALMAHDSSSSSSSPIAACQ